MFGLIRKLFRRRRPTRGIFQFWDGERERYVDPFEILRAISSDTEVNLETESALMLAGDDAATLKTVQLVRRAFGVKHFNEGGLLEAECLELIERFYDFLGALKKNISESPISSTPMESASSTTSTGPEPLAPGSSSSDSPKTPTAAS